MTTNTETAVLPAPAAETEQKVSRRPSGQHAHLNKSRVRKTALDICAHDIRHKNFRRIKPSFYDFVENATRQAIASRVKQQPSKGKTLT